MIIKNHHAYYSLLDVSDTLNASYHMLQRYVQNGTIKTHRMTLRSKQPCLAIDQTELDRIAPLLTPPANSLTIKQISQLMHLSTVTIRNHIKQLKLKPVLKHDRHHLSPQASYYDATCLPAINQNMRRHNQAIQKYHLAPTTSQFYNPATDLNTRQLQVQLDAHYSLGRRMVVDWVAHGHLDGHYHIDPNGKIFFKANDVAWIQAHYKHKPAELLYNNQQLADRLNTAPSHIINFRKFYGLTAVKVLGYQGVFYDKATAETIIDWYQNPSHRPKPYHFQKYQSKG